MKTIKSKDNPTYKAALKLTKKKYRDDTGLYLLEGVKPLQDALDMGIQVKTVFLSEDCSVNMNVPEELAVAVDKKLFQALSDTRTSQGIIAVAEKNLYAPAAFKAAAGEGNLVIMDRLQDPGNIGTIIRTAEAAGYKGVVMAAGSGDVYSPKCARAAAGSLLRMPIIVADNNQCAIRMAREMGKTLVVTDLDAEHDRFEEILSSDIALVIGNEGQGVDREFIDAADMKIKIPMEGSIESLNVAVAAGILMYQSRKTRQMRGKQDASSVE